MASGNCDAWREIVAGYLRSLYEDARANREFSLNNSRKHFLRGFGTATVHRDYELAARDFLASLLPPPDSTDWQIVEQSEEHVLVQVTVGPNNHSGHQVPFRTTRLLLASEQDNWQIVDVFEPCFSCNMTSFGIAGQCFFCCGTGRQFGLRGRRFRWFKRTISETEQCKDCGGTGKCSVVRARRLRDGLVPRTCSRCSSRYG